MEVKFCFFIKKTRMFRNGHMGKKFSLSRVVVIMVIIGCFNGTEESCAAVNQKKLFFVVVKSCF